MTDGRSHARGLDALPHDEADNTWAAADEDLTELVSIMKRECMKSSLIKGAYILAADDRIPFFSVHFLIHYGEYDILPFGSSSKRRATSERKQKT